MSANPQEKRRQPRVPVNIIITSGDSQVPLPLMFSRDISTGGISVETTEAMAPNGPVRDGIPLILSFSLPFGSQFRNVPAKIAWVRHNLTNFQGNTISLIGIQFIDPDAQLIDEIDAYIRKAAEPPAFKPPVAEATPPIEHAEKTQVDTQPPIVANTFVGRPLDFYTDCLQRFADLNAKTADAFEQHAARFSRALLPRERNAMKLPDGVGTQVQKLLSLHVKLETEAKLLDEASRQSRLPTDASQVQALTAAYKEEADSLMQTSRDQVSQLYAQAKAEEGQLLTGLVNRADTLIKKVMAILNEHMSRQAGGATVALKVQLQPVKHYLDSIAQAVAQAEPETTVALCETPLEDWETWAFINDDTYWTKEERAVCAAVTALGVKLRDELNTLLKLYDAGTHIGDEVDYAFRENAKLLSKLDPKYAQQLQLLQQNKMLEKQQRLQQSYTRVSESIKTFQELLNSAKGNVAIDSEALRADYNQKLYAARPKQEAAKPAKERDKKKGKRKAASIVPAIVMFLIAAGITGYQLQRRLVYSTLKTGNPQDYAAVLQLKAVNKWENWLMGQVDTTYWNQLIPTEKRSKIEALMQKSGCKFIEIKNSENKTVVLTVRDPKNKQIVLRIQ